MVLESASYESRFLGFAGRSARAASTPRHTFLRAQTLWGYYFLNFRFQLIVGQRAGVVHGYFSGAID